MLTNVSASSLVLYRPTCRWFVGSLWADAMVNLSASASVGSDSLPCPYKDMSFCFLILKWDQDIKTFQHTATRERLRLKLRKMESSNLKFSLWLLSLVYIFRLKNLKHQLRSYTWSSDAAFSKENESRLARKVLFSIIKDNAEPSHDNLRKLVQSSDDSELSSQVEKVIDYVEKILNMSKLKQINFEPGLIMTPVTIQ